MAQAAPIAPAMEGRPALASRRLLPAWAPFASLLLHGAVLGAALFLLQRSPPPAAPGETGVEFLWDQAEEASLATGEATETPGQPATVEGPPPPEPAMAQPPPSAPMAAAPAPPVPPPEAPAPPREAALPPPDPAVSPPPVAPPPPAPGSLALALPPVPPDAPAPVALPPPAPPAQVEPEAPEVLPLPPSAPATEAEPETAEALPLPPPMPSPPPPSARPAPARQAPAPAQAAPPARAPGPPPMAATPGAGAQASIAGGSQALGRVSPPGLLDGVRNPEPEYPYLSRQRGEQGTVSVLLRISEAGRVLEVELLRSSGHPTLDDSAKRAALLSRFKPAMRDDMPVPGTIRTSYHFRLDR
nr:energy transducer TonB [Roseicella aerolata]